MSELQDKAEALPQPERVPQPITLPYTNLPVPEPLAGGMRAVGDWWGGLRSGLIHALPAPIVNSSSNVVGAIQLVAEALMFKSSNLDLVSKENRGKPLHWVIDPPRNIVKGAFGKFKFQQAPQWNALLRPSSYVEGWKNFVDLERAARIDSVGGTKLLVNNLSALSSLTGMSAMTLASLLPDRKESPEETQQMARMAHEQPLGYVGMRLKQAVNPLDWWDNKRQIAGLGMTATGVFSFLSGFRQVAGKHLGEQSYRRNPGQIIGGAITTAAGAQLLLAINNQQGWTSFGTTQLGRLLTLPNSIGNRYKPDKNGVQEQGRHWYAAAQATMVVKNTTASLLGGAEKLPDGTIVDHGRMRVEARERVRAAPGTQVQGVQREAALEQAPALAMQA